MKKIIYFLLIHSSIVFCQGLEWSGYFEPQMTGMKISDKFYQISSNKLRLDLGAQPSDNVEFGANLIYMTYHGKTEWNILDYLPDNVTKDIPPAMKSAFVFTYGDLVAPYGPSFHARPDRIFLDNAYIKLTFPRFDLTIGKQQISMGTGYTWNPTDLFNSKDVLDPTYEQPGHNAVRFDIPLSNSYTLVSIYAPEDEWNNSVKLVKLKGRVRHFDFSLLSAQRYWTFTDYTSFQASEYDRKVLGGDLSGELLGMGVWFEGAKNFLDYKSGLKNSQLEDFTEYVVGGDYTFESQLYIMTEFYHNSLAPADYKDYTLNTWMWMLNSELKSLCQDQLTVFVQYPVTDLLNAGCSTLYSISDNSTALVPMLIYNVFEDVEITAFGNFYLGKEGRCYSQNLGNGGLIRLRYYF